MNSKTKIVITVGAGLLLSAIAGIFGFQPLLKSVQTLNETLGAKQSELNKIEKQIVEFKSAQADLARATFKDDVYGTIVVRENLSEAIVDMEAAAAETGTEESIQISEATETAETKKVARTATTMFTGLALSDEVSYTMSAGNSYPGFVNFLQYLENLPHFTEFDRITLNAEMQSSATATGGISENSGGVAATLQGVFLVKKNAETKK